MRPVEEQLAAPRSHDLGHLPAGQREEGHRHAQRHELRPRLLGGPPERVEVHVQLGGEGDVHDAEASHAGRSVRTVAGVPADGLRRGHHRVTGLCQRGVDGQVADHAGAQAVIGVVGAQGALEQFHAKRLDLVDVFRPGEPAIHRADVALGGPGADLRRQQRPHGRARRRLRGEQVEALLAPPALVALDRRDHLLGHLPDAAAGIEHLRCGPQRLLIVDFESGLGLGRCVHARSLASRRSGTRTPLADHVVLRTLR